jgi:hypothetical protein
LRIDPHFLDCVAFVCSRTVASRDRSIAGGTAFFVEVEDESDLHLKWTYVVTALHCIDEIRAQNIYIRVNTLPDVQSNVGFENIPTCKDEWFRHDKADVAAILLDHNPERHVVQGLSLDLFIDREYRFNVQHLDGRGNPQLEPGLKANFPDGIPVQAGDDLFSPGLFVQSAGKKRNLPAARFRNIARMPSDELVVLRTVVHGDTPIRAYLAESHSWGGHSGSPVFWHYTYNLSASTRIRS